MTIPNATILVITEPSSDGVFLALMIANQNQNNVPPEQENLNPTGYTLELLHDSSQPLTLRLIGAAEPSSPAGLSEQQVQTWNDEGYLVIPDAMSEMQLAEIAAYVQTYTEKLFTPDEKVQVHSYQSGKREYISPCGRAMASLTER